ncbi:TKL protein kinase [Phytophthora cinnamomi]|uniref:TKL protein kinase n=1 Tax=Phytophthora cinnamomi TaxID=4785 RepID=UPI0035593B4F|nr:TKL protein kinase [Phytophthora cinnamomi]
MRGDSPLLALLVANLWSPVAATTYAIDKFYASSGVCDDTPNAVRAMAASSCSSSTCSLDANNDTVTTVCESDYLAAMKDALGSSQYIIQVIYADSACATFSYAVGYRVTGTCERGYVATESYYGYTSGAVFYFTATLPDDGTAVLGFFSTSDCSTSSGSSSVSSDLGGVYAQENILEDATCISEDFNSEMYNAEYYRWYSSNTYDDGGQSTGAIVGIVCGCVVAVLVVAAAVYFYVRRRSKGKRGGQWTATLPSGDLTSLEAAMSGQTGLWNDDVITAKRIPRDKVKCSTDYLQAIRDAFAGSEYSIQEIFSDNTCSTFEFAFGFLVTNSCTGGALTYDYYFTSNITDTGRASVQFFHNEVGSSSAADSACMYGSVEADAAKDQLEHHTCLAIDSEFALYDLYGPEIAYKWYSSNDKDQRLER